VKYHDMLITDPNEIGDCFRTCVACVLDIEDPLDVPHFIQDEERDGGEQWWTAFGRWLSLRGLGSISIHSQVGHSLTVWSQPVYHIASAMGPRGHRHAVIGRLTADEHEIRWEMVHDPHPSRDGLDGSPDRFYFIIPNDPGCLSRCP